MGVSFAKIVQAVLPREESTEIFNIFLSHVNLRKGQGYLTKENKMFGPGLTVY